MEQMPLVSVIIPVYNGEAYMREAIDSALSQTYPHIEVLVINDGSGDGGATEAIALSYGDRIRYFAKENGGVSSALNLGIANMRGDYFSWLSHDDFYTPDKIESQVRAILAADTPSLVALGGSFQVNRQGERLSDVNGKPRFADGELVSWDRALGDLLTHGAFNGCALLIPRTVFSAVGGFHEGLRYSQDFLMWLSIFLAEYPLVYVAKETTAMRVHDGQFTQKGRDIFYRDSLVIATLLQDKLSAAGDGSVDFLYLFTLYNARYNVRDAVLLLKKKGRFSFSKRWRIGLTSCYGKIRPFLRRVYYRLFKRVKTV